MEQSGGAEITPTVLGMVALKPGVYLAVAEAAIKLAVVVFELMHQSFYEEFAGTIFLAAQLGNICF